MRIRTFACTIGITAALATSVISAPLASAAELTITDDVCTTTFTDAELETMLRIGENTGHTMVSELKKLLPSVAADIDAMFTDVYTEDPERLARIEAAGVNAGLKPEEVSFLFGWAWLMVNHETLGVIYIPETITKQEAAELLVEMNDAMVDGIWIDGEVQPWSTPAQTVFTKAADTFAPISNLQETVHKACVDGEPGTYDLDLNAVGGGDGGDEVGGNSDLPGSSGSSGFSFSSS